MSKKFQSTLLLLLATLIWGSAFVSQNIAMAYMQPFGFQAIRCTMAVLALLPVVALADRSKRERKTYWRQWADPKLWKAGILCGIPLFLACNLQQVGLVDTDAGKAGFLTAMYIVIVPIIDIFRGKHNGINVPISVAISILGLYFLSCKDGLRVSTPDLLLLGCALMFAVQITFVDIFAPEVVALRLNTIQAFICAILSWCVTLNWETAPSVQSIASCFIPLLHVGVLSMGFAYGLQIIGQKNLDPSGASLIMSTESVVAVVCGALILGERMTGKELLGCLLVFSAVILSQIPIKIKQKVHP